MAAGLGMTADEWEGLRSQVDDSFWVMRIIGTIVVISALVKVESWLRIPTLAKRS